MGTSFISYLPFFLIFLSQIQLLNGSPVSESPDYSIQDSILARRKLPRIINGTRTTRGAYPFMVSVEYHLGNGSLFPFCGGSIFDRSHVITAAHCIEDQEPEDVWLRFGEWKRNEDEPGEALRRANSFLMHPRYDSYLLENDIAVIVLNDTLGFTSSIQPICLTIRSVVPGEEAYTIGWGDTYGTADNTYLQVP